MKKASEYYINLTVVALRWNGFSVPNFEVQIERNNSMATRFGRLTKGFMAMGKLRQRSQEEQKIISFPQSKLSTIPLICPRGEEEC